MPHGLLDLTRQLAEDALASADLRPAGDLIDRLDAAETRAFDRLRTVTETPATLEPLRALRSRLNGEAPAGTFERVLLLRAWLTTLQRIPHLPLAESVKRLMCEEVRLVAAPSPSAAQRFDLDRSVFVAMSKLATMRRFPAGQLHWEVAGLPRSWVLKVRPSALPRLAYYVGMRMRGFAPALFIHLNANRKDRAALVERESNRSYFRMAQSLALQPAIKGLVASSWLHSPDTIAVSPHLNALNRVFVDNGALVTTMGAADPESGVFTRSPERRRLFEQGLFKPTTGLVIWPRTDMLAWAAAHPELAD
jgi:hypothetical protein